MNRTEHLLVILSEECTEVSKEVCKALRFGLDDHEPNQSITNRDKIVNEFNDLFSIMGMLKDEGVFDERKLLDLTQIKSKEAKVKKWLEYSKKVGTLI